VSRGHVNIVGAGLCGSLLAVVLARRGYGVTLFERGGDPRQGEPTGRRSINLALAARGFRALEHAGLMGDIEPLLVPMRGRMIHAEDGSTDLQPYGQRENERIYSVSRAELNRRLVDAAEHSHGVELRFHQEAVGVDAGTAAASTEHGAARSVTMRDLERSSGYTIQPPVIAADGAGSAIRRTLDASERLGVTESLLPHGYKELTLPPAAGGSFQLDPGALHIWPRGGFMLIALPNPGGDFTLTLFLANDGTPSFAELNTRPEVEAFFGRYFADVASMIPSLAESFLANPLGVLGTVRCRGWHSGGDVLLIGDAAHAIVPFHGQGMNAAFEDCVVLDTILQTEPHDWSEAFSRFEEQQRPNANAIADMALENYVEMRDTVRDPTFVLQKQLAFELERRLPDRFIPRYSMVMFHAEIPYAVAQQRGAIQQTLLNELTRDAEKIEDIDLDAAVARTRRQLPNPGS
jgi:kynurenine 3-monooxygenase